MERQNVTLSLPKDVLIGARHLAVERGESLSGLLAEALRRMVDKDREWRRAQARIEERLGGGLPLGTQGVISWTRDELHER
jgi:hypothetical protein